MQKVIYPITSNITRRLAARSHVDGLMSALDIYHEKIVMREEKFDANIIFVSVDTGNPLTETRRIYTATIYLEDGDAERLISEFRTVRQYAVRRLTARVTLLLSDNDLAFRSE